MMMPEIDGVGDARSEVRDSLRCWIARDSVDSGFPGVAKLGGFDWRRRSSSGEGDDYCGDGRDGS